MAKGNGKRRHVSEAEIRAALKWSGSLSEAADRLEVDRSTLYRWRQKLKVEPEAPVKAMPQPEATRAARKDRRVVQARKRYEARLRELTGSTDPRGVLRIAPDAELARLGRAHLDTFRRAREALIG